MKEGQGAPGDTAQHARCRMVLAVLKLQGENSAANVLVFADPHPTPTGPTLYGQRPPHVCVSRRATSASAGLEAEACHRA